MSTIPWSEILSKPTTISGYGITDAYTKSQVDALVNFSWSQITGKPTTISGYGITDAYIKSEVYNKTETYSNAEVYSKTETYNKTEVDALVGSGGGGGGSVAWGTITNKPTTIAGYGITDAVKRGASYELTTSGAVAVYDVVYVNTAGITVTLPATANQGDYIMLFIGNTINTLVNGNGKPVSGSAGNFLLDVRNVGIKLVYLNINGGIWLIH